MEKPTVNSVLRAIKQGISDEQLRKNFKLKHREVNSFKMLSKKKHDPVKINLTTPPPVCLGSKRESYYSEDELLNLLVIAGSINKTEFLNKTSSIEGK